MLISDSRRNIVTAGLLRHEERVRERVHHRIAEGLRQQALDARDNAKTSIERYEKFQQDRALEREVAGRWLQGFRQRREERCARDALAVVLFTTFTTQQVSLLIPLFSGLFTSIMKAVYIRMSFMRLTSTPHMYMHRRRDLERRVRDVEEELARRVEEESRAAAEEEKRRRRQAEEERRERQELLKLSAAARAGARKARSLAASRRGSRDGAGSGGPLVRFDSEEMELWCAEGPQGEEGCGARGLLMALGSGQQPGRSRAKSLGGDGASLGGPSTRSHTVLSFLFFCFFLSFMSFIMQRI
jgi:hypothetical protein